MLLSFTICSWRSTKKGKMEAERMAEGNLSGTDISIMFPQISIHDPFDGKEATKWHQKEWYLQEKPVG